MARLKKKPTIIRTYTAAIVYICPVRGEITEIREINVYGTGEDWIDSSLPIVSLDEIGINEINDA